MSTFSQSVGPYRGTYDSNDVGQIEGIWDLSDIHHAEAVRSQLFGDAIIDWIYRQRDSFVLAVFKEWDANKRAMFNPYGSTLGQTDVSGRLASDLAKTLVLTAVAGTPAAAANGPATRTYALALLAAEHVVQTPLGPVNRDVPILFGIIPAVNSTTGVLTHYVDT